MKHKLLSLALTMGLMIPAVFAERIVVVGDSITGHSKNLKGTGYFYQFNDACKLAGLKNMELVPLGGSGQGVGSWRNVVKNSIKKDSKLDIPDIMVKTELDKKADYLVIFLGQNDTLAPYFTVDTVNDWVRIYQMLIDDLKVRTKFKKLVLLSPTMCTENPDSLRNLQMRVMADAMKQLAIDNQAVLVPLFDDFLNYWTIGRMGNPAFRMTLDFVHPNKIGHTAITCAILKGIGQPKAAELWYNNQSKNLGKAVTGPGVALWSVPAAFDGKIVIKGKANFEVESITVKGPETLRLTDQSKNGKNFSLVFIPDPMPLKNKLEVTVKGQGKTAVNTIDIYAPFSVVCGFHGERWFSAKEFKPEAMNTAIDALFVENGNWSNDVNWKTYMPSGDLTGGNNPDSVDFSSFSKCSAFEQGWMVRVIQSPAFGKAQLELKRNFFSGNVAATVYWNGEKLTSAPVVSPVTVPISIKEGKNLLAVRVSHVTWQFQLQAGIRPVEGGLDISKLIYSAK